MTLGVAAAAAAVPPTCIILSRGRAESIFFFVLPPCSRIHIMYDFFHGRKAMVKTGGEGGGGLVVRRCGVHRPVRAAEHAGVLRWRGGRGARSARSIAGGVGWRVPSPPRPRLAPAPRTMHRSMAPARRRVILTRPRTLFIAGCTLYCRFEMCNII